MTANLTLDGVKAHVENVIIDVLFEVAASGLTRTDCSFEEIGADDLEMEEIFLTLEMDYGIQFSMEERNDRTRTIDQLIDLVKSRAFDLAIVMVRDSNEKDPRLCVMKEDMEAIREAVGMELNVEIVAYAMGAIKADPTKSIKQAVAEGVDEWMK